MALRAQCSLIFQDEELFNNFILQQKMNKSLNNTIIRCLTAYYYNPEVRNLIEDVKYEDVVEEGVQVSNSQDLINNVRDIMAIQNFMATELENTMQDGIEHFSSILDESNKKAEEFGVVERSSSEFASTHYQIKQIETTKSSEHPTGGYIGGQQTSGGVPNVLAEQMQAMFEFMSMNPEFSKFMASRHTQPQEQAEVVQNSVMSATENEVPMVQSDEMASFDAAVIGVETQTSQAVTPVVEEEQPRLGEADEALKELYDSLGI